MKKNYLLTNLLSIPALLMLTALPALAQVPGQAPGQAPAMGPQLRSLIFPIALCIFVFYLLVWRPDAKRRKQHAEQVNALRKNDRVVTAGGVHGTVAALKGRTVIVKVDDNVKLEISKSAITTIISRDDETTPDVEEKDNG